VGGCLSQTGEDGAEHPIAFHSQKLSQSQMAWSTIEREAYSVIASLKKFNYIIFGAHVTVYSDHNPLTYIVGCASKSARLTRWSLALEEHNLSFKYRSGKMNTVADYLSRPITVETKTLL
jgi:hypothetical protein